jgi:hypothetical protein
MSNSAQVRQPSGAPESEGGRFASQAHAETGTQLSSVPAQPGEQFDSSVAQVAAEQGWSDETLGHLALEFLRNGTDQQVRSDFLGRLTEAQDSENEARADDAVTFDELPVHEFYSTGEGYNDTQTHDDIHDGDVLSVPREGVYGFLYEAWPVAVTAEHGEFHTPDLDGLLADKPQYAGAVAQARRLAAAAGLDAVANGSRTTKTS